jgi:hypothetical protein
MGMIKYKVKFVSWAVEGPVRQRTGGHTGIKAGCKSC